MFSDQPAVAEGQSRDSIVRTQIGRRHFAARYTLSAPRDSLSHLARTEKKHESG